MAADDNRRLPVLPIFEKAVKLLIVVDATDVSARLLIGAQQIAAQVEALVEVVEMPSVRELASAIALAERMAKFDGYVALGCVTGGETAQDASNALTLLGLQGAAVGNGLVFAADQAQALALADPLGANKGGQAAAAALHLIALSRKWASDTKGIGFRP